MKSTGARRLACPRGAGSGQGMGQPRRQEVRAGPTWRVPPCKAGGSWGGSGNRHRGPRRWLTPWEVCPGRARRIQPFLSHWGQRDCMWTNSEPLRDLVMPASPQTLQLPPSPGRCPCPRAPTHWRWSNICLHLHFSPDHSPPDPAANRLTTRTAC